MTDEDEIIVLLRGEAGRSLPGFVKKVVDPWVEKTVSEILAWRVTSAGPTRGGEKVQVRFRLGDRSAASSHKLSLLRDANTDFLPQLTLISRMRAVIVHVVTRSDLVEDELQAAFCSHLENYFGTIPGDVVARVGAGRPGQVVPLTLRSYLGDIRRMSYDLTRTFKAADLVLAADGVKEAMDAMCARAAELAVSVPHHRFPDSGRKLEHENAKRKLLKAMKVALLAGVTDQELEEIKNEALVNQIMSDV